MRYGYRLVRKATWLGIAAGFVPGWVMADVVRDGTIGPDRTIQPAGPDFEISESLGELRGNNLFHSFEQFSFTQDQSATFTGVSPIENVISRVTGGEASRIDGVLRSTVPGAAVYLMNPHGIVFGPNAALDLQGAFHVGTASTLQFENGEVFSASADTAPILSIARPDQFGFLGEAAGIELQGSFLINRNGVELSGGAVDLNNGATVISKTEDAVEGGEIAITAGNQITLSGANSSGQGSSVQSLTTGEGKGGAIHVEAPVVELRDGAGIGSSASGTGAGGVVTVTASQRLTLSGHDSSGWGATLQAGSAGAADAGALHITAPTIELQDGSYFMTSTQGSGAGGDLSVVASGGLTLSGVTDSGWGAAFQAITSGEGHAGDIRIEAGFVELRDGALMSVHSNGSGFGGALDVMAQERVVLSGLDGNGRAAALQTGAYGDGAGGSIHVRAPVIELQNGAFMESVTEGPGNGGEMRLEASDYISLSGRDAEGWPASLEADTEAAGNGGSIYVQSPVIALDDRASIRSTSRGSGDAGAISVVANNDALRLSGGDASTAFDSAALLRPSCVAQTTREQNGRFVVAQQRGLPLSPEDLLMGFDAVTNKPSPSASTSADAYEDPTMLATAAFRAGQFEQAGAYWTQASARAQADGNAHAQGQAWRGVAQSQQVRGHYGASLATLQRALVAVEAVEDEAGIAATQGQIGNAYLALGEAEQAERWLREAIARAQVANDPALLATLHNNLGNHYMVQQHYAAALQAYEASAQHAPETDQRATALSNGARAALDLGQADRTRALLDQARVAAPTLTAGHTKIAVLIHLAKTAERLGEVVPSAKRRYFAAAYTDLREAILLSRKADDLRRLSYALGNLGHLYQREHRHAEALYLTRLAEQAAEQARAPDALYRWHWQAGQLLWAQGEWEAALQAYRRAVALLEDSRQETLAQYGAASVRFRQAVAPVYEEFVDVLLQWAAHLGDNEPGHASLLEARATVEQLKAAELRDYFRDECVTELEAKTVRLETVSPQAAVIYPIVLPQRLELLVSLPTGLKRFTVPVDAATLTAAIQRFRERVETRASEARVRQAGYVLYTWLIEPFMADLDGVDTLVFVPGGPLRTVPLAALYDGEDYLIQRYRVAVTPGLALTDPRPFNRRAAKLVLAGLSQPVQQFPALPAVSQELRDVQQIFGGRILLDQNFTATQFQHALAQPVSVVHLASHAQFTGEAASSFLLTYDGRLSLDNLDRYLSVTRFRESPLELLVLSACQTAAGDERAALGLAGVGIKAGARSAVGSLWAIDDEAAAMMMAAFYRELKAPEVSKARALQAAQQHLAQSWRFSHPYYWSPYLLVNNWL